jgi:alpha,alpha-trehalose phosphorylase
VRVTLDPDAISFAVEEGIEARVRVRGVETVVSSEADVSVPLDGQGPRLYGAPTMRDVTGSRRADGSLLTASIPTLSLDVDEADSTIQVD